ncbi:1949_t:CDS:2, partial [Ambispora leptoticha]
MDFNRVGTLPCCLLLISKHKTRTFNSLSDIDLKVNINNDKNIEDILNFPLGIPFTQNIINTGEKEQEVDSLVLQQQQEQESEDDVVPLTLNAFKRQRNGFEASRNTPWTDNYIADEFDNATHLLNREVADFVNYISPLPEERKMRQSIILRINRLLRDRFDSNSVARAYGSYNTDLYLPSSDIDIVLFCDAKNKKKLVDRIASIIRGDPNLATKSSVIRIPFARVPIVKFVEKSAGYPVDISFNQESSLTSADVTKNLIQQHPGSKELLLVVKYFLASLSLNDPSQGGMGSYTALLLVISLLQKHPLTRKPNFVVKENLGTMLIEFFKLYGIEFDYKKYSINVSKGSYEEKPANNKSNNSKFLVIPDPSDPSHLNVATATNQWIKIRKAFASAYETLQETINHVDHLLYKNSNNPEVAVDSAEKPLLQYNVKKGITLLGTIISIDEKYQDARTNAVQSYLFKHGCAHEFDKTEKWFRRAFPPNGKRKQAESARRIKIIRNTHIDNRNDTSQWYDKNILMDYKVKKYGIELLDDRDQSRLSRGQTKNKKLSDELKTKSKKAVIKTIPKKQKEPRKPIE